MRASTRMGKQRWGCEDAGTKEKIVNPSWGFVYWRSATPAVCLWLRLGEHAGSSLNSWKLRVWLALMSKDH